MTILNWELFPLTKSRSWKSFFFSITLICIFLASSVKQSRGLTCYDCVFNPDHIDEDALPFDKTCKQPVDGTTHTTDCNATSLYCVKKFVKVEFNGGTTQQYMSRECSGSEELPDLTGKTPPLCFAFTGFDVKSNEPLKLRNGAEIQLEAKNVSKNATDVKESSGRICVCNTDKCNKGEGEMITDADGTNIDPPSPAPTQPTTETEKIDNGGGLILISPPLYFLPFFLPSGVLVSACAIPTSSAII